MLSDLIAALVLLVASTFIYRGILSFIGGDRPRLEISVDPERLSDVDWAHLVVRNEGLPLSRFTRVARGVRAYGRFDGMPREFQWATTERDTKETVDIYHGLPRRIPIAVRIRPGYSLNFWHDQLHQADTTHLTEVEYMTQWGAPQGRVKIAPHPLTDGDHDLQITVEDSDGHATSAQFMLRIPKAPADMLLEKK